MAMNRASTTWAFPAALLLVLTSTAGPALGANPADEIVSQGEQARNGAGLQISSWQPDEPAVSSNTNTASYLGYFTKGLDQHLAWESSLGYWGRTSKWSETQFLGTTNHELQTHLVPTITALRLYPATTSGSPVEPYLTAGLGPVLGIQQQKVSGAVSASDATAMLVGFGVRAGAGVDVKVNRVFGITAGGHFESASFGQDMVNERLYKAWGADVGLSYRFQYR